MKTLVGALILGLAGSAFSQTKITDFSVFSKTDIEYARSDFEGMVGAGGNILVQDFSFVTGLNAGVMVGHHLKQSRGYIGSTPVVAGRSIQLDHLRADGSLTAKEVYLDNSTINGTVRANYFGVTTGYMGYATSSYKSHKKMSVRESDERYSAINNQLLSFSYELDNLSLKCRDLTGEIVSPVNGKLVLAGAKEMNVFHIDGTSLHSVGEIVFQIPAASTAIVNISGDSIVFENLGVKLNSADPKKIIWNIFEAASLRIRFAGSGEIVNGRGVGMPGTFVAPYAEATFNEALITGSLFVKKLDGDETGLNGGQVNFGPFNGRACEFTRPGGKR